jgi:transposase-like protein
MRKQYPAAFKARVVQELLKEEKTLAQIAAEYEVHPTPLKHWRAVALEGMPGLFEKQGRCLMQDETRCMHCAANAAREEYVVWHKPVYVSEPFRMPASR